MQSEVFRRIHPLQYYRRFLEKGVRPDGRRLARARDMTVVSGTIGTAAGSALVRLGNTSVLCGVKLEVCRPTEAEPGRGLVSVEVFQTPLAARRFGLGRASAESGSLARAVEEVLLGAGVLSLEELCIDAGRSCWVLHVDLYCLSFDGGMLDASLTAAVAALQGVRVPEVKIDEDGEVLVCERRPYRRLLQLRRVPVGLTLAVVDGHLVADPTAEEEELAQARCTAVLDERGQICALLKPGGHETSEAVLKQCVQAAKRRGKEVRKVLAAARKVEQAEAATKK